MDEPQRERIRDDLKGLVRGDLLFDDISRTLYSTDASLFEVRPLGVVLPRDEEDVQALVRYAAEHQVPLVPRGAGTGVAGESLGAGLVVDLSKHFAHVVAIEDDVVRAQPGVVLRDLESLLARAGRRFAAAPAHAECTVGGMVATNASGANAARHGTTRDYVSGMRLILDSGDAVWVGRASRWRTTEATHGRLDDIVSSLATLLEHNADLIRRHPPRTPYDRCGYRLDGVLMGDHLHLPRLLTGSEGTLGFFTEVALRTVPLPGGRGVALLGFASLESALRAARTAGMTGPTICELLDRRLLSLARGDSGLTDLVPANVEAMLLVEYEADTPSQARGLAADLADRVTRQTRLAVTGRAACDDAEAARFWRVRESAFPGLYGLRGGSSPLAIIEDVGLPPEALPGYLPRVQELLRRHETSAVFLIHALAGQVHMRPFLDPRRREDSARLWPLADDVYDLVLELGGTIASRHGIGLARTPWVSKQAGPLHAVYRELKAIFDPRHVFNPGKIVGPSPTMPAWPLRQLPFAGVRDDKDNPSRERERADASVRSLALAAGKEETTSLTPDPRSLTPDPALRWRPGEMEAEAVACNGCGTCRTREPARRMCPIFRATGDEAATPRAKANLMRQMLAPDADPRQLASDEVRAVADLCVNCKMCARECPARVQIPRLMLEAKAANVAQHGMSRSDWVMARSEFFAWLGSAFAPMTNWFLGQRGIRWLMEKLFGVARRRRLPRFANPSFLRLARRRGWAKPPHSPRPRVAYFVDVFANYNDPSVGEAVVSVLQHNGIEVYVPPGQRGCGMAPLTYGDIEGARDTVRHNLRLLADVAREGCPILCSEPTAAVMLRQDAPDLLDDPDVRLVASQTVEFTAFVWDLHQQGVLRTDFGPLEATVGHHVPCHLKALGREPAGPGLLSLIPGLQVRTLDVSCSGMAGTFGFKTENYDTSLAAGRPMLDELSRPGVLFGSTECSPCRVQMEQGAGKRTLHPAQYMALAYGLMPQLRQRLDEPLGELVLP